MGWDLAIGSLAEKLPNFNDDLLIGYRKRQISNLPGYMDTVFNEATRLLNGQLVYKGHRLLSPERRVKSSCDNKLSKGKYNIQRSELSMYEYVFEFEGIPVATQLFIPYLHDGILTVEDSDYYMLLDITERGIFRGSDEVTIKVMRFPLQFWKNRIYQYTDTEGNGHSEIIVTVKAFDKSRKNKTGTKVRTQVPLLLYLLAEFPFEQVCERLDIPVGAVQFTTSAADLDTYFYVALKNDIFLQVERSAMDSQDCRRFVAALLSILEGMSKYTISSLMEAFRPRGSSQTVGAVCYLARLGYLLHPDMNREDDLAASHALNHLESLRSFLDQYTKEKLKRIHVYCNDIFELFLQVYSNIDSWLIDYSPNDMMRKCIAGADVIMANVVQDVFTKIYKATSQKNNKPLKIENIRQMLRAKPMQPAKLNKVVNMRGANDLYNDNDLIGILSKKIRQTNSQEGPGKSESINLLTAKEHQFHPSFLAVESCLAISSSQPGSTGRINPFAVIDDLGCFHSKQMAWYKLIEDLNKYLAQG